MIDSIWGIFTIGLLLGAPSGIAPGPMLILIISETLRHGIRAGAKVACTPLLTDIPLVLTSGFIFTQILNMNILLGAISLFGSVFLLYSNRQCRYYRFYSPLSPLNLYSKKLTKKL
jgi:threonine/homoserine/homoserine lactone efflux protein